MEPLSDVPAFQMYPDFPDPKSDVYSEIAANRNVSVLAANGGVLGLAKLLKVDPTRGVPNEDVHARQTVYGTNTIPKPPSVTFLELVWEALQDPTLIMLICASLVSVAIGIYEEVTRDRSGGSSGSQDNEYELGSWVEGVAIMVAVVAVVLVSAGNDYQKERQFRKLNAKREDRNVTVIRSGERLSISVYEVVVGDILIIDTGDVLCADGVLLEGHDIQCDESSLTGESDAIKKIVCHGRQPGSDKDDAPVSSSKGSGPFLLSGSKVLQGVGSMVVTCVGEHSMYGSTLAAMSTGNENTPLQDKLADLSETIGKIGLAVALLMLFILIVKYCAIHAINKSWPSGASAIVQDIVGFIITAVAVVVMAVPEGLPMAVTLALAYATIQMLRDNNLVRILAACETMGGATTICSDKTGTLTQNRMTVVQGLIATKSFTDIEGSRNIPQQIGTGLTEILAHGICINSNAAETVEDGVTTFLGSKTEVALLEYIRAAAGFDYSIVRQANPIVRLVPFSSDRKRMSTVVRLNNGKYRLYCKGAAEMVLANCLSYLSPDPLPGSVSISRSSSVAIGEGAAAAGNAADHAPYYVAPMTEEIIRSYLVSIESFANNALRAICMAYRDFEADEIESLTDDEFPSEANMTLIGIVGIQDPLRPEVPHAVRQCQQAGIRVRMVTGDNLMTARAIARECGILSPTGIVMEGQVFRRLNPLQMSRILPSLEVLARSSPTDKQLLVRHLKEMGHVVAVTGDGTNDGPALKLANVGFAMGIAGTEVAKEAAHIILMDDNFASIVRAVVWGRGVFDAVRKFLQFQLTINVVAVTLSFVSAISDPDGTAVLSAVQLLWVNLIMDTLAALALATEPPTDELLQRPPHPKTGSLISRQMWKNILGQSAFQLLVCFILYYLGFGLFDLDSTSSVDRGVHRTIVFNTFVFMQFFNEVNCRVLDRSVNIFRGLHRHLSFILIMLLTVAIQVLVVEFGGAAFRTHPLNWYQWLICIGIGFLSWPLGLVVRVIPISEKKVPPIETESVTRGRLLWETAISDVRTQIRVVNQLRRHRESYF